MHMSLNIRELMDKIVDGSVSSDDIKRFGELLEDGDKLGAEEVLDIYEDLSVLRYNYTMEVLMKTVIAYLVRHKPNNGAAAKDYRRAARILKVIIQQTEELYEAEQED
jgi:hypothetical protein